MDTTAEDPAVQDINKQMEDALQLEHANGGVNLKKLLNDKSPIRMTRRLVLCFMIYFMQMFTGINVIAFYGEPSYRRGSVIYANAIDSYNRVGSQRRSRKRNQQSRRRLCTDCFLARNITAHLHIGPFRSSQNHAVGFCSLVAVDDSFHDRHCSEHSGYKPSGIGDVILLRDFIRSVVEQYAMVVCCRDHTPGDSPYWWRGRPSF
jgi:hypothetical protein